jgi:hypothetical protein
MSTLTRYGDLLIDHYSRVWGSPSALLRFDKGPMDDLPAGFCVAEFQFKTHWRYATVGMAADQPDGLEGYIIAPRSEKALVEILYALAHFNVTGAMLGLGDTVNFGKPVFAQSCLEYGFVSYPYLEPDGFEQVQFEATARTIGWIIPITQDERDFKKMHGPEALEERFEAVRLDYSNPRRSSVV